MRKRILISGLALLLYSVTVFSNEFFPEIAGWKLKEDKNLYTSEDLWRLIDGEAEIFLNYYFVDLHMAEYSSNDQIVKVELYKHQSERDAYGIYSAERMSDFTMVNIGGQGYKGAGVLNFMTGNYYVRIISVGSMPVEEEVMTFIAASINNALRQPNDLPEELALFPHEGQVYLSDKYIAKNFLGYSFFQSAFLVRYNDPVDFQLFIIHLTPEKIQHMLEGYFQMMKEDKVQQKGDLYIVTDLFNGILFLQQKDDYLIGVLDTDNETVAAENIQKVITKLP